MESLWSVFYPAKYQNPETDTSDTLYMRIRRVCSKYPARVALEYGYRKFTYASFLERIDETALAWKRLGVQKDDKVLFLMGHNPLNIISVYALDKIGAQAALAVPNLATEHFEEFANHLGAKFCLMSCNQYLNYSSVLLNTNIRTVVIGKYNYMLSGRDSIAFRFYPLSGYDTPSPKHIPEGIRLLKWEDVLELPKTGNESDNEDFDRDNNRPALYLFPSVAEEGIIAAVFNAKSINLSANLTEMVFRANEDLTGMPARMLCLNESCFALGFVAGIHNVLSSGQTVLLFTWYDNDKLFFAIKRYKPDVLIGYNSTVAAINKAGRRSGILRSVDRIIVGGGLLTSSQKATLFEIAQGSGRKLSVCSITGCDELLAYAYGPSDLQSDRLLGFPVPGVIMRVADSITGLDVPDGAEGEIAVCSPVSSSTGEGESRIGKKNYRKLPDGRIWYFTGKIGKQDGNKMFYLVGSRSREARINSYPVYPDKVDEAVQMTEGVVESCSVIIEKQEGPVLISAVVPNEEYFYDNSMMEDLRDRIKSECGMTLHEAMRPSEVVFLVALPRDSRGVIDYDAVKEKVELLQDDDTADDTLIDSSAME
ncbi:MAG: acyl--CoA ligase [Saccharofermentans sp.]|nr:acyl--CoA ligase [Saccharofermentans sp.]